jgi:hypothetical protein
MWNDEKQRRFDALRLKEAQGVLADAEVQELQALFVELEAEEAETLKKSMEKLSARLDSLRAEKEYVEAKNQQLAAIVAEVVHEVTTEQSEQEQLLTDAREYLTRLRGKQSALRAKYQQATKLDEDWRKKMTITLDLPQELEQELSGEAAKLGLSLSEYALRLLSRRTSVRTTPKTGTELVAYWQAAGLVGTRTDITDSQKHARAIRAEAERRTRKG